MAEWEKTTGGKMLAIRTTAICPTPHFALTTFAGEPMSKDWPRAAALGAAVRGDPDEGQSESHPSLSTTDEFAVDYELWDRGNLVLQPKQRHDPA